MTRISPGGDSRLRQAIVFCALRTHKAGEECGEARRAAARLTVLEAYGAVFGALKSPSTIV